MVNFSIIVVVFVSIGKTRGGGGNVEKTRKFTAMVSLISIYFLFVVTKIKKIVGM